MRKKSLLAVAISAAALAGLSTGPALAGEVAGPPGTVGELGSATGRVTGAVAHSNSICAFNGLNDMLDGPLTSIVQTPHNQGSPGEAGHGTCRGGTNFHNPPSS